MKNEDFLQHFGVKGMKWGKTSSKSSGGASSKKRKKKISEMTNDELKTINARLQLEKQYKDLTKKDTIKGRKFVKEVLTNSAKTVATAYATKAITRSVENLIKNKAGG